MATDPSMEIQYVRPEGTLTYEGMALLQDLASAVTALEATATSQAATISAQAVTIANHESRLDAIAAVAAPAGGATVDTQARTAINAIRTAAV